MVSLICPWHCSHRGTETGAACLSCHLKLQTYIRGSVPGTCGSPAPKMRTSADSWQPEGATQENCCSASCTHGTARTEAQSLGLLAYLATSSFKLIFGVSYRVPPSALLRKRERLQIARSQKRLPRKTVAQPLLPMALLAQRHRAWGCLLVLPPQTSNVSLGVRAGNLGQPCCETANACR